MIRVDRSAEPPPPALSGKEAEAALAAIREHFEAEDPGARQQRYKFESLYHRDEVREALGRLFAGKCAFCESSVDTTAAPIVHHFRPKQEAVDADGGVSRPHYWWLVYEWENTYLSCQRCATAAGPRFPVAGERAAVGTRGAALDEEKPLLLDPCRDDPGEHLSFQDDGSVAALSERGEHTIAAYALNRLPLREARRQAIAMARAARGREFGFDLAMGRIAPYSAAIGQALGQRQAVPESVGGVLARLVELWHGMFARLRQTSAAPAPMQPVIVERLEIRDFRCIEWLDLSLAEPEDEAPWTMVLGENGQGKTSVLQALALVLMGDDCRDRLALNPRNLIRHGAERAEIVAYLRGAIEPRSLRIESGGIEAVGPDGPSALAAYGAARIPSTNQRFAASGRFGRPRVENLFDPASPLTAAEGWLRDLDKESFGYASRALRLLLLEPDHTKIEWWEGSLVLCTEDGSREERKEIALLSDGYRSMIALAVDVMSFFMARYGSMDAAEGVVLVDELTAHLHPRWQMRVVGALREAFPRLQFVATTHDPLSLRGLADRREVVILRRTEKGQVYALPPEEVPPVTGMRVDELLTSEAFGLNSTVDPDLERLFDRYYALLASHDRGPQARREIAELRDQLAVFRQFGSTRRERLALEVADEYLARKLPDDGERVELLADTKDRLRAIWAGEEV